MIYISECKKTEVDVMLKRVLIYLNYEDGIENVLNYAKMLEEKYNAEIYAVYVKDIRKYELITPSIEGLIIDGSSNSIMSEWEKIESANVEIVKAKFAEYFDESKIYVEDGITTEIVIDKLRGFDLLLITKGERISSDLKTLMRLHYKPIIVIPDVKKIGFHDFLFANDEGLNASRSLFTFMNLFGKIEGISSISINVDEVSPLIGEYITSYGIKYNEIKKTGDAAHEILKESEKYDILIMGELRHYFMIEKLTGKAGVTVLEKIKKPVFIG